MGGGLAGVARAAAPSTRARASKLPRPVLVAIAAAWAAAIVAQLSGTAAFVHHDSLLADGAPTVGDTATLLVAWQAMVIAMMLPSSLPLVRLLAAASARAPRPAAAMAAFLSVDVLLRSAAGAAAGAVDLGVHARGDESRWLRAHEWLIGSSVRALAGAFQFTPLKDACLRQCRHPAAFLLRYYARGAGGAFRLGARHGAFCVGCCWVLMLVTFAVGVTSLVWMVALTTLMVHEKTHAHGARTVPMTGVALLAGIGRPAGKKLP